MPLIVLTGYPCSGKTHRACQLASAFEERIVGINEAGTSNRRKFSVLHVPSYHSSIPQSTTNDDGTIRDSIYNSAALEKTARGAELSAIKRALSKDAIVIADDLNYIKGFRYQLWCEAKAAGTRCCTVHCAAREDEVKSWNRTRLRQWVELTGRGETVEEDSYHSMCDHVEDYENEEAIQPESHTALYGDRTLNMPSRSRSSSMEVGSGEEFAPRSSAFTEESLKSLSLADRSLGSREDMSTVEIAKINDLQSTRLDESPKTMLDFPPPCSPPYSQKTLQSLLMRYEPPSPFSKWDTPLFTIPACDSMPPVSAIWDALFPPQRADLRQKGGASEAKAEVKPHAATILPNATGADALQILESIIADAVAQIVAQAQEHPELADEGGNIQVKFADITVALEIPPGTILSLPMLQRLRRRFTQIQRGGIAHGRGHVKGEKAIGQTFVRFLNAEMGT